MEDLKKRNDERTVLIKSFLSFASSFYVLPLYLLFSLADFFWYRDYFLEFLVIRVASVVLYWSLNKIIEKKSHNLDRTQQLAVMFMFSCALPIHLMIMILPDVDSPYYAGLILIIMGIATGLRFTLRYYCYSILGILIPYLLIGFLKTDNFNNFFLLNFVFLVSVVAIASVGRYFYENISDKEFNLRMLLENEILNRDVIIQNKTAESIRLKNLSRQFSPQIVKSINDGSLDLTGHLIDTEVCAMFIDIVDSTKKIVHLDPSRFQSIITSFVEDAMGLMLKYDITIDKFLGDGVLGFSNTPVKQDDYVERVIRCAFELIERLKVKEKHYSSLWGDDFNVRIGISLGKAAVGFYGSDLHVRSYTAVGRVINLAARINGAAPINGILITEEVVEHLRYKKSSILSQVNFKQVKEIKLKGFESEEVKLFEIQKLFVEDTSSAHDDVCPRGHGVLFLHLNSFGIYELKCRECDYVLQENINKSAA